MLPAALRDTFVKTGRPAHAVLDLEPADDTAVHFADGTTVRLPNDGREAAALGRTLGAAAESDWDRFIDLTERLWGDVRTDYVESALPARSRLERLRCRRAPTARAFARRSLGDARLVQLVEQQVFWAGSDPRVAPSGLAVLPYVEHAFRRWRIVGGMPQLVDVLEARARQRGVEIRTGVTAAEVRRSGGRVTGVALADGTVLDADIVVTAVPAPTVDRLLGRRSPDLAGASAFVVLLGLAPGRSRGPGRSLWLGPDVDDEYDAVFGPAPRPVDDPTIDVTTTPGDGEESWVVRVAAPAADRFSWTPEAARRYTDHLLERLAIRHCDVRDRVAVRHWLTPADIAVLGGDDRGWASGGPRSRRDPTLRPNAGDISGLFHVGDGVHPGGGVSGALLSAGIVAELIDRP